MTVIDYDTGEIVATTALDRPTIAEPGTPITPAIVAHQCRSVEVWAEHCESIPEIRDTANKLDAIGQYIARTGVDGRAAIEATLRRLEARIGDLLGPAPDPSTSRRSDIDPSLANEGSELTPNQRSQFRKMADHPDIVENVIDNSTDDDPASRRKVIDQINRAKHTPNPAPTPEQQAAIDRADAIRRAAKRCEKFLDGFDQVAGLASHQFRDDILAALNEPDRLRLLSIEQELFA